MHHAQRTLGLLEALAIHVAFDRGDVLVYEMTRQSAEELPPVRAASEPSGFKRSGASCPPLNRWGCAGALVVLGRHKCWPVSGKLPLVRGLLPEPSVLCTAACTEGCRCSGGAGAQNPADVGDRGRLTW